MFIQCQIIRNVDRRKFTYNGQEIAFDGKGYQSFDNDYAKNVVTFLVDNSSSSHTDNLKNNFSVLDEGPTKGINDSVGVAKISINFSKANTKFCLSQHYNGNESYLYVNKTEIVQGKDFRKDEQNEISLSGAANEFSVEFFN